MPVERHEQDGDSRRDVVGWLRARVADGEEERARLAAASVRECDGLRAEVAMLRSQIADIVRLLEAAEEAAPQIRMSARAEGWRAGYDQRAAEEAGQVPPRAPGERHLRIVGIAGAACASAGRMAGRMAGHKAVLGGLAAATLITAATVPWHTTELRVATPGHGPGSSVVAQAFAPQGRPSSPPGQGKSPHPSPGGSHGHGHGSPSPGPQGTPHGHAAPSPSPDATTDPGTPSATPGTTDPGTTDPSPTPADTPAACTPAS